MSLLCRRLPAPRFRVGTTDPRKSTESIYPEEQAAVAKAVPRRRSEYFGARHLARELMAELGLPPSPIPSLPDRRPAFPAPVVGSIAHCEDLCVVVLSTDPAVGTIGVDVEPAGPVDAPLVDIILTPRERARLADHSSAAKVVFVCKEAFYKAQYPWTERFLDFHQVELRFLEAWPFERSGFVADAEGSERPVHGQVERFGLHWIAWVVTGSGGLSSSPD